MKEAEKNRGIMFRPQGNGVTAELRATRTANPTVEVKKAIARKDLRFLGVAGYSVTVPGIPGKEANPVVRFRGVREIKGTSDAIQSDEHGQLQQYAYRYAAQYNHLLFTHLLRANDPAIAQARRVIDRELRRMEQGDPIRDAKQNIKEAPPLHLLSLREPGKTQGGSVGLFLPGIDPKTAQSPEWAMMFGPVFTYAMWPTVFITEIMTPMQRQQLMLQTSRYIVPYNRYLFAHSEPFLNKERERLRPVLSKMRKAPR